MNIDDPTERLPAASFVCNLASALASTTRRQFTTHHDPKWSQSSRAYDPKLPSSTYRTPIQPVSIRELHDLLDPSLPSSRLGGTFLSPSTSSLHSTPLHCNTRTVHGIRTRIEPGCTPSPYSDLTTNALFSSPKIPTPYPNPHLNPLPNQLTSRINPSLPNTKLAKIQGSIEKHVQVYRIMLISGVVKKIHEPINRKVNRPSHPVHQSSRYRPKQRKLTPSLPLPIHKIVESENYAKATTPPPKPMQIPTQISPSTARSECPAPERLPIVAAAALLVVPLPLALALVLLLPSWLALALAGTASVPVAVPTVLLPVLAV
jgi:hypothetical protein